MRRTAGMENKMRTRVDRREKGSDRLPPYLYAGRLGLTLRPVSPICTPNS